MIKHEIKFPDCYCLPLKYDINNGKCSQCEYCLECTQNALLDMQRRINTAVAVSQYSERNSINSKKS